MPLSAHTPLRVYSCVSGSPRTRKSGIPLSLRPCSDNKSSSTPSVLSKSSLQRWPQGAFKHTGLVLDNLVILLELCPGSAHPMRYSSITRPAEKSVMRSRKSDTFGGVHQVRRSSVDRLRAFEVWFRTASSNQHATTFFHRLKRLFTTKSNCKT